MQKSRKLGCIHDRVKIFDKLSLLFIGGSYMIVEKNGWFCTDPDCMQYCRKVTETAFELIQAVWLNTWKSGGRKWKNQNRKNIFDSDRFHRTSVALISLKCLCG